MYFVSKCYNKYTDSQKLLRYVRTPKYIVLPVIHYMFVPFQAGKHVVMFLNENYPCPVCGHLHAIQDCTSFFGLETLRRRQKGIGVEIMYNLRLPK